MYLLLKQLHNKPTVCLSATVQMGSKEAAAYV